MSAINHAKNVPLFPHFLKDFCAKKMISIWLLYIKEKIRKNVYRESQRTKRELCASAALIMQVYNEDNARIKEFRLFVCWLVDIMFAC